MMRCLVTGGAGFVGSALTKRLLDDGWKVDVVDDFSTGDFSLLDRRAKLYRCGFADHQALRSVIRGSYDIVFHQAAIARVVVSIEKPIETTEANVLDTVKLFQACREGGVKRIVFASSSSVYGDVTEGDLPLTDERPKRPKSPYALQKAFVEDYARICGEIYGQEVVCLRYFNVFGPGQLANGAYSTVIPSWCSSIKEKRSLRLDGDGKQSRDMAFIDNVVDANILAMESPKNLAGEVINIAGGNRVSLNEILAWFRANFGDFDIENAPERLGDIKHTQSALHKAKALIGYEPRVDFWDGLERTIEWWGLQRPT